MEKRDVVAGLDVGSGRVTVAIGAIETGKPGVTVLAGASVACAGVKGGLATDIQAASAAIRAAVEEAEKAAGERVSSLYLGVRGDHLKSSTGRGRHVIARPDREITPRDVEAAIRNAEASSLSEDRVLLHVTPQGFILDGRRAVSNPVGMTASLLDVDAHIVTADAAALDTLEKAVNDAGFSVAEPVYGLLAAAELVLTPTERELGCLLFDIGGETMSFGYFDRDSILLSRELAMGSDTITRDVAYGLHASLETAEQLKVAHGLSDRQIVWRDADAPRLRSDGRVQASRKSNLRRLMTPRVKHVFSEVSAAVLAAGLGRPIHGAVLTGGGALLKGLDRDVAKLLDTDARIGVTRAHPRLAAIPAELLVPRYVTAVGLLLYSSEPGHAKPGDGEPSLLPWDHPWLRWLKELREEFSSK
ncbi:MAG: cell division protein FtsA [Elusimicrobia bacterium]|nr:cell division protein FtsA [Elusimicrobiota bacterium]